ncbi:MAG: histidinol dehydrogenase [Candidatus Brocadiia bacterium]
MIPEIVHGDDADFEEKLSRLEQRRQMGQGLEPSNRENTLRKVQNIVREVRERGDEALLELTERFDGVELARGRVRVSEQEITAAVDSLPADLRGALEKAADRIRTFQENILVQEPSPIRQDGRELGLCYGPVDAAAICVPGASASLASSVLMNVVPAAVAGVERIVMITPPRHDGTVSADRLAAARIAGATEVYRVFGAQGVAAAAYGTESLPSVDFIAGPGNIYVATAKKVVFGQVGIDMIAGPSEVVVVADDSARASWVTAELLAQAEHTHGSAILLTDDDSLARTVAERIDEEAGQLADPGEVESCLEEFGAIVVARDMDQCLQISNRLAPEHLVLMVRNPEDLRDEIRHAGAIFMGHFTPVAVGDYIGGPSHTLPTGTTARFSSGLTANHFRKSTSYIRYDRSALQKDGPDIRRLAEAEKLKAHARSVAARVDEE